MGRIGAWSVEDIRPLRHRDAVWRAVTVVAAFGSIATPSVSTIRARLTEWAREHPRDVRCRVLDVDRGVSGRPTADCTDAFFDGLVTWSSDACPLDLTAATRVEPGQLLDGFPFRLTVGTDWAVMWHSHAIGDGTETWDFLGRLLSVKASTSDSRDRTAARLPLGRALLHTFGRSPGQLADAVSVHRAIARTAAVHADTAYGARPMLDGVGGDNRFDVIHAFSEEGFLDRVRRRRDTEDAAGSVMAILTLRATQLCRSVGLNVDNKITAMVDMRRYLPPRTVVDGNFTWSKSVPLTPSDTPSELTSRMSAIVLAGLPLLVYGRERLRRRPIRSPKSVVSSTRSTTARLMVSYGNTWHNAPEPASPEDPAQILVRVAPPGRDFIGINMVESHGRLHVSVNWSPDLLERDAAERIAVGLVSELDSAACAPSGFWWECASA